MTILREIKNGKGKKEKYKKGIAKKEIEQNGMEWKYSGRSLDGCNMVFSIKKAADITHSC